VKFKATIRSVDHDAGLVSVVLNNTGADPQYFPVTTFDDDVPLKFGQAVWMDVDFVKLTLRFRHRVPDPPSEEQKKLLDELDKMIEELDV
jgi:hypothetical protein